MDVNLDGAGGIWFIESGDSYQSDAASGIERWRAGRAEAPNKSEFLGCEFWDCVRCVFVFVLVLNVCLFPGLEPFRSTLSPSSAPFRMHIFPSPSRPISSSFIVYVEDWMA